jgi:uncharacterized protein (TIGR02466 family)
MDLFPTALYITELDKSLIQDQMDFFESNADEVSKNSLNYQSNNSYVLEEPCMKYLKNAILDHINFYKDNIMSIRDKVDFYITQSWLNYTHESEGHHSHYHPNSILSGVLYISTDKNDSISFIKDHKKDTIQFSVPKKMNVYNSDRTFLAVKDCALILFPSSIQHEVIQKNTSSTRISLAFNTFFKGEINHPAGLMHLKI